MNKDIRRKAFIGIIIGTLLVAVPLAISSFKVAQKSHLEYRARGVARQWLDRTDFDVIKIEATKDRLELVITGSGASPLLQEFSSELQARIDREIQVRLKVISSRIELHPNSVSDKP